MISSHETWLPTQSALSRVGWPWQRIRSGNRRSSLRIHQLVRDWRGPVRQRMGINCSRLANSRPSTTQPATAGTRHSRRRQGIN